MKFHLINHWWETESTWLIKYYRNDFPASSYSSKYDHSCCVFVLSNKFIATCCSVLSKIWLLVWKENTKDLIKVKSIIVVFLTCSNKENKSQLYFAWSFKEDQPEIYSWGRYNICPYVTYGQMLIQVQNHWFSHRFWMFSTSENQAAYFAAQPRLFKPKVVTHLFILRSSAWSEWSSTWGFYTKMCK